MLKQSEMSVRVLANGKYWSKLAITTILLLSLTGCDAHTSVRGVVVDAQGNAIAGAEVRLVRLETGRAYVAKTDQEGRFMAEITHGAAAGKFKFSVTKAGYVSFRKEVEERADLEEKIVLIRELESAKPGSEPKTG